MAIPRAENPARHGDQWGTRRPPQGSALPQARMLTPAEHQQRSRAGNTGTKGKVAPVWGRPRNGLPVRFYRYRGTGADAFTGEVVQ